MESAARDVDTCLWNMLEQAACIAIPGIDEGRVLPSSSSQKVEEDIISGLDNEDTKQSDLEECV